MSLNSSVKSVVTRYLTKYPKIAFVHVPKCAGVSVYSSLYRAIYPDYFKGTRMVDNISLESSRFASEIYNIDMMKSREVVLLNYLNDPYKKFVTGHCHASPKLVEKYCSDWDFLTVLRNPVDRFISEYVYNRFKESKWAKLDEGIDEYLLSVKAKQSALTSARYFSGLEVDEILDNPDSAIKLSIDNLSNFKSVGFVTELELWYFELEKLFSCKIDIKTENSSPKKDLSKEMFQDQDVVKRISELSKIDIQIYQEAFKKFGLNVSV